jgi:hypothetical protein
MPPWLFIWILRWSRGERFRKATPQELRWYSGYFALILLYGACFLYFGKPILDHGSYWAILFWTSVCVVAAFIITRSWARLVTPTVSWVIGGIEWSVLLFLALTGRLL